MKDEILNIYCHELFVKYLLISILVVHLAYGHLLGHCWSFSKKIRDLVLLEIYQNSIQNLRGSGLREIVVSVGK